MPQSFSLYYFICCCSFATFFPTVTPTVAIITDFSRCHSHSCAPTILSCRWFYNLFVVFAFFFVYNSLHQIYRYVGVVLGIPLIRCSESRQTRECVCMYISVYKYVWRYMPQRWQALAIITTNNYASTLTIKSWQTLWWQ